MMVLVIYRKDLRVRDKPAKDVNMDDIWLGMVTQTSSLFRRMDAIVFQDTDPDHYWYIKRRDEPCKNYPGKFIPPDPTVYESDEPQFGGELGERNIDI